MAELTFKRADETLTIADYELRARIGSGDRQAYPRSRHDAAYYSLHVEPARQAVGALALYQQALMEVRKQEFTVKEKTAHLICHRFLRLYK